MSIKFNCTEEPLTHTIEAPLNDKIGIPSNDTIKMVNKYNQCYRSLKRAPIIRECGFNSHR